MKAREATIGDRDAELAADHSRLRILEQKLKAERAELDVQAKVLAEDRAAFKGYKVRSCKALQSL